jgi:hypothetical protein
MLITLIVLAVLNLVLSIVVFCSLRVLWARLPEPVTTNTTVGDVASDWMLQAAAHRADPLTLTPEEQAQVAAYRAKWKGGITESQSDLEVLALARLNAA